MALTSLWTHTRPLVPWLLALLVLAVAAGFSGCTIARHSTYPAPKVKVPSPPPRPIEEVALGNSEERLMAWHITAEQASATTPVLLVFHGNGENLETMRTSGILEQLTAIGAHVLAIDYPGYGLSGGKPCEERVLAAGELAYAWLTARYPKNPRLIWGWSLGAAVAAQIAARHASELQGVVLLSAWTKLEDVVRLMFPSLLVHLFLRDEYDTLAVAPRITAPTLILHGTEDTLIPIAQGRTVADALPRRLRFVAIPEAGHNDLLDRPEVWSAVRTFIESFGE